MATNTTRLSLVKPDTTELALVSQLNSNSDKLDSVAGMVYASTTTRPSTPFQGQPVYESDTGNVIVHNGSSPASGGWEYVTVPVVSATTAFPSPNTNQLLMLSGDSQLYRYTGSAWVPYVAGIVRAVKTSDNSITSSTTLTSDAQLTVPVVANATYALTGFIVYAGLAAADARLTLSLPASATCQFSTRAPGSTSTGTLDTIQTIVGTSAGFIVMGGNGSGVKMSADLTGVVTTAGTAGNVAVQFAQDTSNATATVFYTGSWIMLTRIS